MNDDKKSIIVILGMVFLSIMIILPPLFRIMFPKEKTKTDKKLNEVQILSCERTISNSNYSTSVVVTYKNGEIEQNLITYTKIDESSKIEANQGVLTPEEESSYFSNLNNINITNTANTVVVLLNKKLLEDNSNDQSLSKYLQSLEMQGQFYNELGYSCSIYSK